MLDLKVSAATVVDGSGSAPFTADVGVVAGRIVEVGRITSAAHERVNAEGAWLTPGFVDIHTHYDGQASWDAHFAPSLLHGATTVVMGNCGVGFAPRVPGRETALIELMEGVEDIPGAALAEGVRFEWESFPQYLDALAAQPRTIDVLAQVPHDPLRMAVMGERAVAKETATLEDIAQMCRLLRQALLAGAAGFSSGRSDNHRTARGQATPASEAGQAELVGLARAFEGLQHGVLQLVSDFDVLRGPEHFDAEFDLVEAMARAAGRPLSMSWLQRDPGAKQWRQMRSRVEAAVARGLPLSLQAASRGIGVILGLDTSFQPFMGFAGYKEVAHLPLAERAAALREPSRKAGILAGRSERVSGEGTAVPPLVDILLERIEFIAMRMFPLAAGDAAPDYEPPLSASFFMRARELGVPALELLYDHLCSGDGRALIYFPIFNYGEGTLDVVHEMLTHPRALWGLSDAGAHVGTICDASSSTFVLTHWVRDRERRLQRPGLALPMAVEMLTRRNAAHLGLTDRGHITSGQRADFNLIDPTRLATGAPEVVRDLPAGGRRLAQVPQGYVGTWVAGVQVASAGRTTGALPGRLVRMGVAGQPHA
jgi:N-acyl-D-aspartate/D-glutamate deacylase